MMSEEKQGLPPVKELLEQMYGVKLEGPKKHTQEEWDAFWKKVEEGIKSKDGPKEA